MPLALAPALVLQLVLAPPLAAGSLGLGTGGAPGALQDTTHASELAAARTALEAARAAQAAHDPRAARAAAGPACAKLLALSDELLGIEGQVLLSDLSDALLRAEDARAALAPLERAVAGLERARPSEDPDLLVALERQAAAEVLAGSPARGAQIMERVLAARIEAEGSESEAADLARIRLARASRNDRALARARELMSDVVARRSRSPDGEGLTLALARVELGALLYLAGEHAAARDENAAALELLEARPAEAGAALQGARYGLSIALFELGDLVGARQLQEQALADAEREGHPDGGRLLSARRALANTLATLGDLSAARALEEAALETAERTLSEDDPDLSLARANLAATLGSLGEFAQARVLQERVLAVRERRLPAGHPELLRAQLNLATTLLGQGDLPEASARIAAIVAVLDERLPEGHTLRVGARANWGRVLYLSGEHERAREIQEGVLAVREATLPAGHPEIQAARLNLAATLKRFGNIAAARELEEALLADLERRPGNPLIQSARTNLARTALIQGDRERARSLVQQMFEPGASRVDPTGMEFSMPLATRAWLMTADARARSAPLDEATRAAWRSAVEEYLEAERRLARRALSDASPREAEERVLARRVNLAIALSFAAGAEAFPSDPELVEQAFLISESCRAAALTVARLSAAARADSQVHALRARARAASEALVRSARTGAADLDRVRQDLDEAQRDLARLGAGSTGTGTLFEADLDALVARLAPDTACVSWLCHRRADALGFGPEVFTAFVLRRDERGAQLACFDLGPSDAIAADVGRWRELALAERQRGLARDAQVDGALDLAGHELRARVLDPLRPALGGVRRLVVVLDDALHGVPLDALPAGPFAVGAGQLLGDLLRVEVRSSAFELLPAARREPFSGGLLALGHPAFDAEPDEAPEVGAALASAPRAAPQPPDGARHRTWERAFAPLPATREEVRGIGAHFEDAFGEQARRLILERRLAARDSLVLHAPSARWLHVATHGWFAPESVRSTADVAEEAGLERVRGSSPMVLAGLALAGANLPAGPTGRIEGLLTAQEIAALDLGGCELAVLSACDTNVGVRRAGQGVASLQRALHMAGARAGITSLWRVPDEATRELMVDFYRRLWLQKKPAAQALWEAKVRLREARDESGAPRYALRDWAAWVLSGESG
ncbi:MAG: CHAT domain-containing protein [Planctomycetes bacterium]|nr:CHAT domain-containing protein [Planctomycetota bacterium]